MIAHIPPNAIQNIDPISRALSSLSPQPSIIASLDESIKNELEAARAWYFEWLIVSTVVVFVGVLLEEAEGWVPYLKRVLPLQPITEYRLVKKLSKLGWILICMGVMGEGVFEVLVSRADTKLQHFQDNLITEARRQAGDAATSAKEAGDEAVRAKKAADDAEAKLAKIVDALKPRELSDKDEKDIANAVRPFAKPTICVEVRTLWNPPRLAYQIFAALKNAGFSVDIKHFPSVTPEVAFGSPPEQLGPGGVTPAIITALSATKRVYLYGVTRTLPKGSCVVIYVGERIPGVLPK